jgi:predicted NAD/FAD-binding protein
MSRNIAIIGGGSAGLFTAYFLSEYTDYSITIYEKEPVLGGHAKTVIIDDVPVDPGFYAISRDVYPKFTKLLNKLNIEIEEFDVSVSYRNDSTIGERLLYLPFTAKPDKIYLENIPI